MPVQSSLSADTIYIILSQVLGAFFRICIYILVGRSLGASALGTIIFTFAIIEIVHSIVLFGFDRALIRFGSLAFAQMDFRQFNHILLLCLRIPLVLSLLLLIISIVFLQVTDGSIITADIKQFLTIGIMILPLLMVSTIVASSFRASGPVFYYGLLMLLTPLLWFIFVFFTVLTGYALVFIMYSYAAAVIVTTAIGLTLRILLLKKADSKSFSAENHDDRSRSIIRYALIMAGSSLSLLLINKCDRLILGVMNTMEQTGLYGAAVSMTNYIGFMAVAIGLAIAPQMSILHNKKETGNLIDLYKKSVQGTTFLALPLAVLLFFAPSFFMKLFGKDFVQVDAVVRFLVPAFFAKAIVGPAGYVLTQTGYEKWEFFNTALTTVLNIILCLVLIPRYGALGAAVSLFATFTLLSFLRVLQVRLILSSWGQTRVTLIPLATFFATSILFIAVQTTSNHQWIPASNFITLVFIIINALIFWCYCPYDSLMILRTIRQINHDFKKAFNFYPDH